VERDHPDERPEVEQLRQGHGQQREAHAPSVARFPIECRATPARDPRPA
jgi:hypothetical protein